ncbi:MULTISPECIES: radical SAM protein [unclassified Myroides]|uniref:radical SAM protein n=1 Tax=unclassified Myroides TaxID=2642485 RepID=UPI003D2F8686
MKYKLSKYVVITDSFIDHKESQKLVYSTRTGDVIILNNETIKKLINNNFYTLEDHLIDRLIFSEIVVPELEDELDTVLNEFEISKLDSDILSMTITPSANCQLGCEYCGQVHSKLSITKGLSEKIFDYIKNKLSLKEYSGLDIVWYGAEPLMGINAIRDLSERLLNLCSNNDLSYSASMITNGLNLNRRNFQDLVANMQIKSFQITIDGTQDTHDKSRFTKKKEPTFEFIVRNIVNAINDPLYEKENVSILIRVNVHENNYLEVDKLLDFFHDLKIQDKIQMSFAAVHDWGNNNANKKIGLSMAHFADLEIGWFLKMKELNFRKHELVPQRTFSTCMTTSENNELIDAKGEISYCWEVPYTPDFESNNDLIIGNVSDQSIHLKDSQDMPLRNWYNDIRNKNNNSENCNACEFLPVCGGHCPISWFKGIRACPSFKLNIEDKLIMQYIEDGELLNINKR